jgi:hypothetical protein
MKTKSKLLKILKDLFIIFLLANLAGLFFAIAEIHPKYCPLSILALIAVFFLANQAYKLVLPKQEVHI